MRNKEVKGQTDRWSFSWISGEATGFMTTVSRFLFLIGSKGMGS